MNLEIKKLHQQLIETHQNLAKRLGNTSDPDGAEDILREMEELNFRVMMARRLLFKETTATIDRRIGTVVEASTDLDEAIKDIAQVKELVKAVGKFLTLVDRALDVIKLLWRAIGAQLAHTIGAAYGPRSLSHHDRSSPIRRARTAPPSLLSIAR